MTQRLAPVLAMMTMTAGAFLSGRPAEARVRAGVDVSSTLPLGSNEQIADPAFTGRIKLQWLSPNERLVIGLVGGQARHPHRTPGEPTLTGNLFGMEAAWIFGPKDWGTRPYLGFQAGFAQYSLSGGATFDPPSEKTSSSGIFIIPEAGLAVSLTKNFGLRFDFRFSYLRSFLEMDIADLKTYVVSTMGLGAGVIFTF